MLHTFAVEKEMDYHDLKPMVCALFPVTYDNSGLLTTSIEADDGTLVCMDTGPSLYRGTREELLYYFGTELTTDHDRLESKIRLPSFSK